MRLSKKYLSREKFKNFGVDYGKKLETNFFLSILNNSNKFP